MAGPFDGSSVLFQGPGNVVTESLIAFILTSVAIELTPGPNMAYLAILSLNRGRLAGAAAVAGVALGLALLGVGAALGLGSLIARVDWLYEALRWGGVLFLLWLAFDIWRDARRPIGTIAESTELAEPFRQGLVTNLLNPKAALFYTAVLPNFLEPERQGWEQSALLTAVYVLVATLIHAVVVLAADAVRPLIESAKFRDRLGTVFAVLLVVVAVWLAISTRRV